MIGEKKKCIGLIFGGYSNEHEVSISSAKTVFQAFNSKLNKQRFNVKAYYINKNGDWFDSDLSEKILIGEIQPNKTKKQLIFPGSKTPDLKLNSLKIENWSLSTSRPDNFTSVSYTHLTLPTTPYV